MLSPLATTTAPAMSATVLRCDERSTRNTPPSSSRASGVPPATSGGRASTAVTSTRSGRPSANVERSWAQANRGACDK